MAPAAMSKKEAFHMMPKSGWVNDPNGPFKHGDTYHMFYQHVPDSATWEWGLCWGHAVSRDMVHWRHLPVAIKPTPGSLDQDGCFSGSATQDENGNPVILYTGVIRKPQGTFTSDVSGQYEFQLIARPADPSDPDLTHWITEPYTPFLPAPAYFEPGPVGERPAVSAAAIAARHPAALDASKGLSGWRDPFVVARPNDKDPHFYVIVGAGEKGRAGTALLYRSRSIHSGWEYVSELCRDPHCRMLECPLLFPLEPLPARLAATAGGAGVGTVHALPRQHLLCYSADYCANVSEYHVGPFNPAEGAFDLAASGAPAKMDLGDIFYAPNILNDDNGRIVLWAWMQERERPAGDHSYACCLSAPRCLWLAPGGEANGAQPRLWQEPLPELSGLRSRGLSGSSSWRPSRADGGGSVRIASGLRKEHLDIELEVEKTGQEGGVFAVILNAMEGGEGAAIVFNWETGVLQVVHSTDVAVLQAAARTPLPAVHRLCGFPDPAAPQPAAAAPASAAGRDVEAPVDFEYADDGAEGALSPHAHDDGDKLRPPGVTEAAKPAPAAEAAAHGPRRCGGKLSWLPAGATRLGLRVLIDNSLVEVFTSTGEVLSTRVYRQAEKAAEALMPTAPSANGGIELLSLSGCAAVKADAWEVGTIWMPSKAAAVPSVHVFASPMLEEPAAVAEVGAARQAGTFEGSAALREMLERLVQTQEASQQRQQEVAGAATVRGASPQGGSAAVGPQLPPGACRSVPVSPSCSRGAVPAFSFLSPPSNPLHGAARGFAGLGAARRPPPLARVPSAGIGGRGAASPGFVLRAACASSPCACEGSCSHDAWAEEEFYHSQGPLSPGVMSPPARA